MKSKRGNLFLSFCVMSILGFTLPVSANAGTEIGKSQTFLVYDYFFELSSDDVASDDVVSDDVASDDIVSDDITSDDIISDDELEEEPSELDILNDAAGCNGGSGTPVWWISAFLVWWSGLWAFRRNCSN